MVTLGERIDEMTSRLLDLQKQTKSVARKQQIAGQLSELLAYTGQLVDANVSKATNAYKQATDGLQRATSAIKRALADLKKVAEAIDKIAEALDLVGRVVALAA